MTKIVQVGAGHWGKNLVRNFAEIGALGGIVEANPQVADQLSQAHGAPVISLEQALSDPEIAGLAFATPAETHAALAIQALEAGKHVYVEKPLALSVADGQRVIATAKAHNRVVMVGHLLQYHSIYRQLKAMVLGGEIGQLRYIYSNRMSLGKFRLEENVWWSFAPHDISMVLGLTQEEPTQITAQGASYVTPGLADWCTAQFGFASGVKAHFNISWYHPFKEQRLVAIGDKGMLVFEDSQSEWGKKLALYRHTLSAAAGQAPVPNKADADYIDVERSEPLKAECQHFVDCITNNQTPLTDAAEGLAVLRCLEEGEKALQANLKA